MRFSLCDREDWGLVVIQSGKYAGAVGYYDEDERGYALVMLPDRPFEEFDPVGLLSGRVPGYRVMVRHSSLLRLET